MCAVSGPAAAHAFWCTHVPELAMHDCPIVGDYMIARLSTTSRWTSCTPAREAGAFIGAMAIAILGSQTADVLERAGSAFTDAACLEDHKSKHP
jgi:hypothetical protein